MTAVELQATQRLRGIVGLAFALAFGTLMAAGGSAAAAPGSKRAPADAEQERIARNKALVAGLFRDVFAAFDVDAAPRYLRPDYIQHNPHVPTGLAGFQNFFRDDFAKLTPEVKSALRMEILHLVAEGDLVAIHVKFSGTGRDGKPFERTEFDLFRIEGDRIAEHWDATP